MQIKRIVPAAMILALALASGIRPTEAQKAAPAAAGAYTAAQAAAGEKLYAANCSACHLANLSGGDWPALVGDAFTSQWIDRTAGDVYYVMSTQMPVGAPGTLKPREYVELLAYILQQNKYPSGSVPLTRASAASIPLTSLRARTASL